MKIKSDLFFRERNAQYLSRLGWDSLRIMSLKNKQKATQNQAIDGWYGKVLIQRAFLQLKVAT